MASTLLETLQQLSSSAPTIPAAPQQSETEKARQLLAARTGKASAVASPTAGGIPAQINTAEQLIQDQQAAQMQQVAQAGQLDQMAQQAQAQQIDIGAQQAEQKLAQEKAANQLQIRLKTNELVNQYAREGRKLDMRKDQAQAEQIASGIRLSTKKYTDNLQMEGARQRLDSELNFREALSRDIFGENEALLRTKLGNKTVLSANQREFDKAMGVMTAMDAMAIARAEARAANRAQMWTAGAGAIKAGAGAYQTFSDQPEE